MTTESFGLGDDVGLVDLCPCSTERPGLVLGRSIAGAGRCVGRWFGNGGERGLHRLGQATTRRPRTIGRDRPAPLLARGRLRCPRQCLQRGGATCSRGAMAGAFENGAQAVDDEVAHRACIAKADFGLGRMDVDIDGVRVEVDEQRQQGMPPTRDEITIGPAYRSDQQPIAHRPAIDEQELHRCIGTVERGQAAKAANTDAVTFAVQLRSHLQRTHVP